MKKNKLYGGLILVITFYLTVLPVSNNFILFPLFFILAGISLYIGLKNKRRINSSWIPTIFFWSLFVLTGTITSLVNQNEYLLRTLVFFLVWPTVLGLIAYGARASVIKYIFMGGLIGSLFISILLILQAFLTQNSMNLPDWFTGLFILRDVYDDNKNYGASSHFLPSLIWWTPIWWTSIFFIKNKSFLPPLPFRFLAATLTLSATLVSWRTGIVLSVTIILFLLFLFLIRILFSKGDSIGKSEKITISALFFSALLFGVSLAFPLQNQLHFFESGQISTVHSGQISTVHSGQISTMKNIERDFVESSNLRLDEIQILSTPDNVVELVIGKGLGASIERKYEREGMNDWQTEMQYHAVFYWTGLSGMIFMLLTAITALRVLVKASKRNSFFAPIIVSSAGALALIIANSTNPYLQPPGHMIALFLPIIIANVALEDRKLEK